jgi:hypothetical protein
LQSYYRALSSSSQDIGFQRRAILIAESIPHKSHGPLKYRNLGKRFCVWLSMIPPALERIIMRFAKMNTAAALLGTMFVLAGAIPAMAQVTNTAPTRPGRPTPPTRDPHAPGFVTATDLPDGTLPPADADGNFIIGRTHNRAPETSVQTGVPQGTVYEFTMSSADSKYYPGIARDMGTFVTSDPADPARPVVTTSHATPYTRHVAVYVPKQYVPGTPAPFIVGADGPDRGLFTALDNLIAEKKVPVMIAISIGNGGGDAQGSERGLEYDTMSGKYAEFVQQEVLPLVEKNYNVKLTDDPMAGPRWAAVPAVPARSSWHGIIPNGISIRAPT